jgi:DNA-directed RNA polymerase subunit beta'
MRTFHTGGVFGIGDITTGLPRVQEIFEVRSPTNEAPVSQTEGKVLEITSQRVVKIKSKDGQILEYQLPAQGAILVEVGERVKEGQALSEGSLDLRKLKKLISKEDLRRYMIRELQRIYCAQGALIHDKHFEVILRQMFSRVQIKDPGESDFTPGETVEKAKLIEENLRLKKERKKPAKAIQLLLGISKVALTTDSFLSAASFQETSRVLIKAGLEGKEDKLKGLKESVIIGRLIPAGTGFQK